VLFEQHSQSIKPSQYSVILHMPDGGSFPQVSYIHAEGLESAMWALTVCGTKQNHNRLYQLVSSLLGGDWKQNQTSGDGDVAHDATPCPWPGVISSIFVHRLLSMENPQWKHWLCFTVEVYKGKILGKSFPLQASLWSNEFEELKS